MTEVRGSGESRGSGLPPGWSASPLAEIAAINPPLDRCVIRDDIEVTFVPMRAVATEGGGLTVPETRRYGQVKKGYTSFLSGDVIMAKITPCTENGKTTVVPDVPGQVCFGSTEFHTIRPEQGVRAEWIEQFLLQHELRRSAQRAMAGGVGQMRVPGEFLRTVRIPVAPSSEQARIAETLDDLFSDLDAGVASLEQARDKLKLYRASVLKAAVEGALTADWRARHPQTEPASELLERILVERRRRWEEGQLHSFEKKGRAPPRNWKAKYKEPVAPETTGLPALPDGWCWATVEQLAEVSGGVTKGQRRTTQQPTREVPYLRVANVQRGYLDLSEMKLIRATETEVDTLRLKAGDVLFTEGGDRDKLGRGWIWSGEIDECVHQNHIFRARPVCTQMQPKLISWAGNSYGRSWFLRGGKQSVNLASINMTVLRSFPVPVAPAIEQEAIVEAVDDQLSVIERLETDLVAELKAAQGLRQSILKHAFTGKLVSQDPNDEPASELLKRIAAEREERAREAQSARRKRPAPRRRRR